MVYNPCFDRPDLFIHARVWIGQGNLHRFPFGLLYKKQNYKLRLRLVKLSHQNAFTAIMLLHFERTAA